MSGERRVPVWFLMLVLIAALPVLITPILLLTASETVAEPKRLFFWIFPFYLIVAAYLAYECYGRRTVMAWILLVIMLLTDGAMWMLSQY